MKKQKFTRPKLTWRDWPESAVRSFPAQPNPLSLNPGPEVVIAAVSGDPTARLVIDAYAFRFPVTIAEVLQ
jgi:hypothetical protein